MSRHRNIRAINYNEEYDEYFQNSYAQSYDDDYEVSPRTQAQFMFNREERANLRIPLLVEKTKDEEEEKAKEDEEMFVLDDEQDWKNENVYKKYDPFLKDKSFTSMEKAQLLSCVEELQSTLSDTVSESILLEKAIKHRFSFEKALNEILNVNPSEPVINDSLNLKERWSDKSDISNLALSDQNKITGMDSRDEKSSIMNENDDFESMFLTDIPLSISNLSTLSTFASSSDANKAQRENSTVLSFKSKLPPDHKLNSSEHRDSKSKISNVPEKGYTFQIVSSAKQIKHVSHNAMIEQFNQLRVNKKPLINLVTIGHVDAGKSTLMGHLLFHLGCVSQKSMHRYETDSKKIGKASFLYAWILDENEEERNRGITMDIAQSKFETKNRIVNVLDAPGHRDFIPNMITGAAQADAALLVVDATCGEFEAGFEAGGQTREHTLLIRSLGVSQVAVVINKLDNVDYSHERYSMISSKLNSFLKQAGFKEQEVSFVPCSGLTGENLSTRCQNKSLTKWYNGPCLLEVIDSFKEPERLISKPFRLIINNIFKGPIAGICISGKIETGAIQIGQKLIIMPLSEQCVVKAISIDDVAISQAFAGDQVMLTLSGCDSANISQGNMLCDFTYPSPVVTRFEARIVIFADVLIPLTKGFPVELHYKSLCEQALIKNLISQVNKTNGEVLKKNPRCLTRNSNGIIEIEMNKPISIELYQNFKDLGRFMIRSKGSTIAAGLVTKLCN